MTVNELILKLKKFPKNLEVGFSAHDNMDWEVSSWIQTVIQFDKVDWKDLKLSPLDKEMFDNLPKKCIILIG